MRCRIGLAACLLLLSAPVLAQNIAGSITGEVVDPTGLPLAKAAITLVNLGTKARQNVTTNEQGVFEFLTLQPGEYDVSVEVPGFKRLTKSDLPLSANQRLSTGPLQLAIGNVAESIMVSGRVEAVQTASAERGATISRQQIDNLPTQARDPLELVLMLPGMVANGTQVGGIVQGYNFQLQQPQTMRSFMANGSRGNNKNFNIDGVSAVNSTSNQDATITPNIDAVEEIQVQLSNYQAEYGRTAGPSINFVTRSGTQSFHGSAYFYLRNEGFNANDFFSNQAGKPRGQYRFRTQGFTIGGPVYLPHKLNSDRSKLFFFFSESQQPQLLPPSILQLQMPSALERKGDLSQTVNQVGQLISITDPTTGRPFPGNVIPANRINALGQQLLSIFPEPNTTDSLRRFNYQQTGQPFRSPRHEEAIKIDYNAMQRFTFFARYMQDNNDQISDLLSNYAATRTRLSRPGKNLAVHAVQTISPTLVNEVIYGYNHLLNEVRADSNKDLEALQRGTLGVKLGQLNPQNNPDNLLPAISFGTLFSGATAPSLNQSFSHNAMRENTLGDNVSLIRGKHTLKLGAYLELNHVDDLPGTVAFAGNVSFAVDASNPNNSNYPYANALLGNFTTYSEVSSHLTNNYRYATLEWYAQDKWRVSNKLTLDYGLRFYVQQREAEMNNRMASFDASLYNPAKAVRLYVPFRDPVAGVVARDPLSGAVVPKILTGAIVPNSGELSNGMRLASNASPSLLPGAGLKLGPRVGFAYDPTGKGTTAVRGGFGIFFDRLPGNVAQSFALNPPTVRTQTIYYGNLDTLLNSAGYLFPGAVAGILPSSALPTVMNFSFGLQQRIGNLFVLDVAYVGSLGRHLLDSFDLNTTPFGTNFLKANEDPTNPGKPLRSALLGLYQGYGALATSEFVGNSNYHSLQTQIKRRFGRRFNMDASWTWSKAMDYADGDRGARSFLLPGWRDYGKAGFDATHTLNISYSYNLPKMSSLFGGNKILGVIGDRWQLSGIANFISGLPTTNALARKAVTYSQQGGTDFTGSTEIGRINLIANPILPKDQRTFSQAFNTAAFAMPNPGVFGVTTPATVDYGNAAKDVFRGPGINNQNLAISKEFHPFESHRLSFRAEAYNVFNHTQFSSVNSAATFNAARQQTNTQFGQYTSVYAARIIQLGLRYQF